MIIRLVDSNFLVTSADANSQQAVFLDSGTKQLVVLNLTDE